MKLLEMNDYDLMRAILDSGRAVVTAFVERGSPDARAIEKALGSVADELGGDTIFGVVDVLENPSISGKFGGEAVPCVALFRDGKHIGTRSSDFGATQLAVFIQQALERR